MFIMDYREMPGAETPWNTINQLLNKQERFFLYASDLEKGYLLAPKALSRLSALLYLLKEEGIPYILHLPGKEGCCSAVFTPSSPVFLSVRAFSDLTIHPEGWMEVGAGCPLFLIQSRLLEENLEVGIDDFSSLHPSSMSAFILRGSPNGLMLDRQTFAERLLQVDLAKNEGGILSWGKPLSSVGGPCLAKLVWGMEELQAVPVKFVIKTSPLPPRRLFLCWSFLRKEDLWSLFDDLQDFTATWERLNCVLPPDPNEKGLILAQISGSEEEMLEFKNLCPAFSRAEQVNKIPLLKAFFLQQSFIFYPLNQREGENWKCLNKESVWYHGLTQEGWKLCREKRPQPAVIEGTEIPIWKQRLRAILREN